MAASLQRGSDVRRAPAQYGRRAAQELPDVLALERRGARDVQDEMAAVAARERQQVRPRRVADVDRAMQAYGTASSGAVSKLKRDTRNDVVGTPVSAAKSSHSHGVQADRFCAIVLERCDHGAAETPGAACDHDAHARASYS